MDPVQHFECDTPDCIHWNDGDCMKGSSVTIQEHHCVDYEQRPSQSIAIVVEGGTLQAVYGSLTLTGLDVELLDLDNAKVSEDEEYETVRRRVDEVRQTCTQLY